MLAGQGVSETSTYWQDHALSFVTANASTAVSITTDEKVSTKSEEKVVCSFCSTDSSLKTIQCSDCKSMCHYACTRLPRYQLYALHNSHRKFAC